MKEISRINHVGLRVRDLAITREFYEKLGFEFLAGPVGPEPVAIMEHPSGVNINFILNASADASPKNLLMVKRRSTQAIRILHWKSPMRKQWSTNSKPPTLQ